MADHPEGFVMAPRGLEGLKLIMRGKKAAGANAFCLLYMIAQRCRYTDRRDGLQVGQCYLSSQMHPLTRQQTRTALKLLTTTGQITTNATPAGTIVTMINTDIFDIFGRAPAPASAAAPLPQPAAPPYKAIVDSYNHHLGAVLPRTTFATKKRAGAIRRIWDFFGGDLQKIEAYWHLVRRCRFLLGGGAGGFRASFDWLIIEDNAARVLEGQYTDPADERRPA